MGDKGENDGEWREGEVEELEEGEKLEENEMLKKKMNNKKNVIKNYNYTFFQHTMCVK